MAVALAAAALGGCGDDGGDGGADSGGGRPVTVYAASSLTQAFPALDGAPRYSFAGSGMLQTQVERGAPADVFASASPKEAEALFREGRCTKPVAFATNVLVLVTPAADPGRVGSVAALKSGRRRLAVGTADVPVGAYTRTLLERLRLGSILRTNTVSEEPNVASIVSKVALGSADAGFVYRTDARTNARVRTVPLPAGAQPPVRYELCAVVRKGADTAGARRFITRVTSPAGRKVLRSFGFGLPPKG